MPEDRASAASLKGSNPPPSKKGKGGKKAADSPDNVSQFIREHPNLSPRALAEEGKKHGLHFKASYVSTVRSKDKAKKGVKRRGRKSSITMGEAEFRRALQGITLARAREIIDELTKAYEG